MSSIPEPKSSRKTAAEPNDISEDEKQRVFFKPSPLIKIDSVDDFERKITQENEMPLDKQC